MKFSVCRIIRHSRVTQSHFLFFTTAACMTEGIFPFFYQNDSVVNASNGMRFSGAINGDVKMTENRTSSYGFFFLSLASIKLRDERGPRVKL